MYLGLRNNVADPITIVGKWCMFFTFQISIDNDVW